ncbi:MAG: hypothetical protein HYZ28_16690 [Myxococcales bacterium]|nr:hypothetical protein [Myxococcales bacterium]
MRYYLVGSVASSLLGRPRLTIDADLVAALARGHARPLRERLERDYYVDEEMILEIEVQTQLDRAYLERWRKVLGVSEVLDRALAASSWPPRHLS